VKLYIYVCVCVCVLFDVVLIEGVPTEVTRVYNKMSLNTSCILYVYSYPTTI